LTVVDRLSKYAHFITLAHPYTATTVAAAFFEQIVRLHGVLASIVSDRDPVFTSTVWREIFCLCGTTLCTSFVFRLQTDGQSEVMNQIITIYLRCLAGDHPKSWLHWLSWAEYCYSTYDTEGNAIQGGLWPHPPALLPALPGSAAVNRQQRVQGRRLRVASPESARRCVGP
jgi:hypothetical protein